MSLSLLHKRDFLRHPRPGKMTMVSRSSREAVAVASVEGSGDSEGLVSAVLSSRGVAREVVVDSVVETEVRCFSFIMQTRSITQILRRWLQRWSGWRGL